MYIHIKYVKDVDSKIHSTITYFIYSQILYMVKYVFIYPVNSIHRIHVNKNR